VREFRPFYDFRRYGVRNAQRDRGAYWTSVRRPGQTSDEVTTDVYLQFVDEQFDPRLPSDAVVVADALCTNGDLPYRLQQSGHPLVFQLETASPVKAIRTLLSPTPTLRPALRRRVQWRLVEHLSSQHWSFSDNQDATAALQELLRLYCLADDEQHPEAASINEQLVDAIESVRTRRIFGRIGGPTDGDFVRGLETTLEIDEEGCRPTSVLLMASVLERFLSASISINSFHQLVARTKQGQRVVRRWSPRAGETHLL
jgi:type VI secretion system protein ImpG